MDILSKIDKDSVYSEILAELSAIIHGTHFEHHVYLVGGAVRDIILERRIHDIDLVVDLKDGGEAFAEWVTTEMDCNVLGVNPVTYERYGTSKFNILSIKKVSDVDIECSTTCKGTVYCETTKEYKPIFGNLDEDALNRDLTINALYLDITDGELYDPTEKGISDLTNHIIRTSGDPDAVFINDPLRMLRVIRTATQLSWGIERYTWASIVKNAYRIQTIAQERITTEINKMLLCRIPQIAFDRLLHSGLLKLILPEVYALKGVEQDKKHINDVYSHTMSVLNKVLPILSHRYAALLHDIAKPISYSKTYKDISFSGHEYKGASLANEIMCRLKCSNNFRETVQTAVRYHMSFSQNGNCPSKKNIKRFMANVGDNLEVVLDLINADNISRASRYVLPHQVDSIRNAIDKIIQDKEAPKDIKVPINGTDIMQEFNIQPSPIIGNMLDKVKDKLYENPKLTREECFAICKEVLAV